MIFFLTGVFVPQHPGDGGDAQCKKGVFVHIDARWDFLFPAFLCAICDLTTFDHFAQKEDDVNCERLKHVFNEYVYVCISNFAPATL